MTLELEALEAAAWADLYDAGTPAVSADLGFGRRDVDGATLLGARVPEPTFNRMLGVERVTDAMLAALPPGASLQVPAPLLDEALAARLAAAGLARRSSWAKLSRAPGPPPAARPAPIAVRAIGPELAEAFGRTMCAGMEVPAFLAPWNAAIVGRPGWTCYLAFDGDTPIGTAALFRHGDLAWLGAGSTVPEHRKKGTQSALIARRIADAAAGGARRLGSETGLPPAPGTNPSLRNLLAAGFSVAYERVNFVRAQ